MSSLELQAILDAAVDAVVVFDHRGAILLANRATEALFGWSVDELTGSDVRLLVPGPDRSVHAGDVGPFLETGIAQVIGIGRDIIAQHRSGARFPARLSVGRVAGADPPQFVGFLQDLSDRAREAEDARLMNQRLMQVTRMATMGEMAAGIAHELNQPLTAITNYARAGGRFLGFNPPELAEAREALHEIVGEAQRAAEIIRQLRRLVRGGDGQHEPAHASELFEELGSVCLADARANDTRLRFELQPGLPSMFVHRLQILQVLLNLVRNALDSLAADPPGQRELVVACRRTPAGDCEISVCDNGPGVATDIRDRMFEPFRSTRPEGTGLGLPMSQTIAQAHGGTLRYEPAEPRGARFILTIPAAEGSA